MSSDLEKKSYEAVCCTTKVSSSTTLLATPSQPKKIEGKKETVVGKIQVILAETNVQIYVDAQLKLDGCDTRITSSRKSLCLKKCELLPTDDNKSSKLLLSGFVSNEVDYVIKSTSAHRSNAREIRNTKFKIPFKCFAKVDFAVTPDICTNETSCESASFDSPIGSCDKHSQHTTTFHKFNQKVICELVEAKIREISCEKDTNCCDDDRNTETFTENLVIELVLRLLQNQNIVIPSGSQKDGDDKDGKDKKGGKGCKDNKDHEGKKCDKGHKYCREDDDENVRDEDEPSKGEKKYKEKVYDKTGKVYKDHTARYSRDINRYR